MRLLLNLIAALACCLPSHAQGLSVGAATGMSYWMNRDTEVSLQNSAPGGRQLSANKELFVRLQTRKRWALEVGVSHDQLRYHDQYDMYWYHSGKHLSDRNMRSDFYMLHLRGQYKLPQPGGPAFLSKFRHYIGVTLSPTLVSRLSREDQTSYTTGETQLFILQTTDFQLWTGLSHSLLYDISRKLQIRAMANFQLDPGSLFGNGYHFREDFHTYARFYWQIGLGYRL